MKKEAARKIPVPDYGMPLLAVLINGIWLVLMCSTRSDLWETRTFAENLEESRQGPVVRYFVRQQSFDVEFEEYGMMLIQHLLISHSCINHFLVTGHVIFALANRKRCGYDAMTRAYRFRVGDICQALILNH